MKRFFILDALCLWLSLAFILSLTGCTSFPNQSDVSSSEVTSTSVRPSSTLKKYPLKFKGEVPKQISVFTRNPSEKCYYELCLVQIPKGKKNEAGYDTYDPTTVNGIGGGVGGFEYGSLFDGVKLSDRAVERPFSIQNTMLLFYKNCHYGTVATESEAFEPYIPPKILSWAWLPNAEQMPGADNPFSPDGVVALSGFLCKEKDGQMIFRSLVGTFQTEVKDPELLKYAIDLPDKEEVDISTDKFLVVYGYLTCLDQTNRKFSFKITGYSPVL